MYHKQDKSTRREEGRCHVDIILHAVFSYQLVQTWITKTSPQAYQNHAFGLRGVSKIAKKIETPLIPTTFLVITICHQSKVTRRCDQAWTPKRGKSLKLSCVTFHPDKLDCVTVKSLTAVICLHRAGNDISLGIFRWLTFFLFHSLPSKIENSLKKMVICQWSKVYWKISGIAPKKVV